MPREPAAHCDDRTGSKQSQPGNRHNALCCDTPPLVAHNHSNAQEHHQRNERKYNRAPQIRVTFRPHIFAACAISQFQSLILFRFIGHRSPNRNSQIANSLTLLGKLFSDTKTTSPPTSAQTSAPSAQNPPPCQNASSAPR